MASLNEKLLTEIQLVLMDLENTILEERMDCGFYKRGEWNPNYFSKQIVKAIEPLIRQDEREKVIKEFRDASHWHRGERCIAVKPLIAIEYKLKATVEKEG